MRTLRQSGDHSGVGVLVSREAGIGRITRTGSQASWAAFSSQDHRLGVRTLLAVISICGVYTQRLVLLSFGTAKYFSVCAVALHGSASSMIPSIGLVHVRCVGLGILSGRVRTLLTFCSLRSAQTSFLGVGNPQPGYLEDVSVRRAAPVQLCAASRSIPNFPCENHLHARPQRQRHTQPITPKTRRHSPVTETSPGVSTSYQPTEHLPNRDHAMTRRGFTYMHLTDTRNDWMNGNTPPPSRGLDLPGCQVPRLSAASRWPRDF